MLSAAAVGSGAVNGSVRIWLRVEGLITLVLATYLFGQAGGSLLAFTLLFFTPDLSFVAYLGGPRIGAAVYNVAHSYVGPLIVGAALLAAGVGLTFPLVWVAHIGFDRALGYGLKYPSAFAETHLGPIGNGNGNGRRD
jgi:hypothetical protein